MEAKNLAKVQPLRSGLAGATKLDKAEAKGKIVEFVWWMKKNGYRETTIRMASKRLRVLAKRGADLQDPESVKETIAKQSWAEATKLNASQIYTLLLKMQGLTWEQPIYKAVQKIPFIPTEKEIDALIAGCGQKLSAFLKLAKETGARSGELQRLKWIDLDGARRTIRITAEKNSSPRILKISTSCVERLQALPKKHEKIFGNLRYNSLRTGFGHQRKKIARKLSNPRLLQIHFHTLRHWKATMLYHQTKDILHVMQYLGHKKIENTLLYIQLEQALFQESSDEFTVRVAAKPDEVKQLLETGFDYICQQDDLLYFRKRK